jgi:hypothetical protein
MIYRVGAGLLAWVIVLGAGVTARADWFEDFNSLPLNYNWSWTGDGAIFALPQSGVYQVQTTGNPSQGWASYGVGYPINAPDAMFTDGQISAVLNPGGAYPTDDVMGLRVRTSLSGPNAGDGFRAAVNMAAGTFDLVRTDNFIPVEFLGHADFPANTGVQYGLSLRALMDDITATLTYPGGSSTLSGVDANPAEGIGGLFVSADPTNPQFPLFAAFDNAGVTMGIPEPSAVILMGLSGLGLLGFAWRRRSKRSR